MSEYNLHIHHILGSRTRICPTIRHYNTESKFLYICNLRHSQVYIPLMVSCIHNPIQTFDIVFDNLSAACMSHMLSLVGISSSMLSKSRLEMKKRLLELMTSFLVSIFQTEIIFRCRTYRTVILYLISRKLAFFLSTLPYDTTWSCHLNIQMQIPKSPVI